MRWFPVNYEELRASDFGGRAAQLRTQAVVRDAMRRLNTLLE